MTMQVFKRFSAALAAAGEQDIIEVEVHGKSVYIVPGDGYHDAVETISVLTHAPLPGGRPGRRRAGSVTPRHLKRLGNANWALTAQEVKQRLAEPGGYQRYFRAEP
jgi:hypothetical protein